MRSPLAIAVLIWAGGAGRAEAQAVTGPELREAVFAVDVSSNLLYRMAQQSRRNRALSSGGTVVRYAPKVTYELADGSAADGEAFRFLLPEAWGSGEGDPGFFWFGADLEMGSGSVDVPPSTDGFGQPIGGASAGIAGFSGLFHAGGGTRDLQVAYAFGTWGYGHVGMDGGAQLTGLSDDERERSWQGHMLAAHHRVGAFAFARLQPVLAVTEDGFRLRDRTPRFVELRANFQPIERVFSDAVGLPFVDLSRRHPTPDQPALYTAAAGVDDLLDLGLRVSAGVALRGEAVFLGELGWLHADERTVLGLRAATRDLDPGIDAMATLRIGRTLGIGGSYSYNTIDAVTSLPIRAGSVFGGTITLGDPSAMKPLIPLAGVGDRLFPEE